MVTIAGGMRGRALQPGYERGSVYGTLAFMDRQLGVPSIFFERVDGKLVLRRGFNIESLAVGQTEIAGISRITIVVAVDDRRYRLRSLQQGEVAIYTDEGDKIVLKRGGTIEVTAATKLRVVSPLVEITGNVTVAGTLTATVDVVGGGKSLKNHVHGGVAAGGSTTGAPV